jgi:DNA-binding NarL/FixJ family response regulator
VSKVTHTNYPLTPRQIEVLQATIDTGSVAAAAEALGMAPSTARVHMAETARRLGTANEGALATVIAACRHGIVDPPWKEDF